MKDYPTQSAREAAIAKISEQIPKEEAQWFKMSRDTFKALGRELIEMPLEEVNTLPDDLRTWVTGVRKSYKGKLPDIKLGVLAKIKTPAAITHRNVLAKAVERLRSNLLPYFLYDWDISLIEAVVENEDEDSDIAQQLQSDDTTKWLFSHMKEELPQLSDVDSWEAMKIRDITYGFLELLSLRAKQKDFCGKCDVCEDWD